MSRFVLAFSCWFRVLFGKKLSPEVAPFLPEELKALPPGKPEKAPEKAPEKKPEKAPEKAPERKPEKAPEKAPEKPPEKPRVSAAQQHRDGALAFLALLQREGRLVDFLREPLDGFGDADIGAAARDVHRGCRKVLEQHLSIEPVMPGAEEEKVSVPKGFDPAEVRLIGEAKGEPPFKGTLRHHGWRVIEAKLPTLADGVDRAVIAPAEVELS